MSIYTGAERDAAAELIRELLSGTPGFRITTIGEIVAAIDALTGWITGELAGGRAPKRVAWQAAAGTSYIAGAARQLVAEAQLHAALAAAEVAS